MGNTLQKLPENLPLPQTQTEKEEEQQLLEEFTCEICIEPTSNQFLNGDNCSHPFCTGCMISYIRVKLDDDNVGNIRCPALHCDHELDLLPCAPLVGTTLFLRWCDVLCEGALVDNDKCYCPYQNCNVLILNECGGTPKKSNCPSCKRLFCFKCKIAWHTGFRCEEMGDVRDENDVALGRLAEQMRWMRCPGCGHLVELREGCEIIKCRCGIEFCYECGKQVHNHLCHYCGDLVNSMWVDFAIGFFILCFISCILVIISVYTNN